LSNSFDLKKVNMKNSVFRSFNVMKAIVKRVAVVVVVVMLLLNLSQGAAMAANNSNVEGSVTAPGTQSVRSEDFQSAREERREWQRQASSVRDAEESKPTTLGEKLNVDELAKGYHPQREAEKRAVPTP
jgi:hypothetical protein